MEYKGLQSIEVEGPERSLSPNSALKAHKKSMKRPQAGLHLE